MSQDTATVLLAAATVEGGLTAYAQSIRMGPHQLVSDEPPSHGGKDAGPAPYQLVLAGLGSCTAITLKMYADRKQWSLGKLTVRLKLFRDGQGERVERALATDAALTPEQREKLLEIAGKTPVTKTLSRAMKIDTRWE